MYSATTYMARVHHDGIYRRWIFCSCVHIKAFSHTTYDLHLQVWKEKNNQNRARAKEQSKGYHITSCRNHGFAKHRSLTTCIWATMWIANKRVKVTNAVTHLQGTNVVDDCCLSKFSPLTSAIAESPRSEKSSRWASGATWS